jgi:hypothetical protein
MGLIPLGILSSAGGGFGTYELIETQILGSSAASITFSGLATYATSYKHLQIRYAAQTTRSSGGDGVRMRINGDTGTNYAWHEFYATPPSVTAGIASSQTYIQSPMLAVGSNPNQFTPGVIDFIDSFSNTKVKTVKHLSADIRMTAGAWYNTASITSVIFFPQIATAFQTGSRFSIYGIR